MNTIAPAYREHIKSVFIDPIRSVLAIDDEYPTIDKILECDDEQLRLLARNENWTRLDKLVKFCRCRDQELLIDIHDGSPQDVAHGLPLRSLRQCDWVVLDYQLNGAGGDGARSCEMLSRLAESEHFNLVTIYTQKPVDEVFKEVLLKFSKALSSEMDTVGAFGDLVSALDDWSDSDPDIQSKILSAISNDVYLRLLDRGYGSSKQLSCKDILGDFYGVYKQRPVGFPHTKDELIRWAIENFEEKHHLLSSTTRPTCFARSELDGDLKWILVGNLFVNFIKKEVEPENLLEMTLDCLAAWNPSPNRLALTKLRAELDASGILADNDVMNDRCLQGYWLSKLLAVDEWEQREQVGALIARQTELLFERLRDKVVSFTSNVLTSIDHSDDKDIVAHFFPEGIDMSDGILRHNTAVSTRPVGGSNLMPGHVLKLDNSDASSDLWICLSPACDLVPCRDNGRDLKLRLSGWLPFTAAKLFKIGKGESLKKANQGHVVFIWHNGLLEQYSLYPRGSSSSSPVWEEFYAKNEGVFDYKTASLTVAQLQNILFHPAETPAELVAEIGTEGELVAGSRSGFYVFESCIVAQLRNEYAVNLAHKLSSHLSRIGLEFSDK